MRIPNGGFIAAVTNDPFVRAGLRRSLEASGASVADLAPGCVLAAWSQFDGQGLWIHPRGAVAGDLDLTNLSDLVESNASLGGVAPENPAELLFSLYDRYGDAFADRLRGAFGFALWDAAAEKLVVATDPYGIRPVYFAEPADGFVAGSRIQHVRHHPGLDLSLDLDAVYQYLFYSVIPAPRTVYRAVRRLAPGSGVTWSREALSPWTYYDIAYRPDRSRSEAQWCLEVRSRVRQAVAMFVPLSDPDLTGCFLSGGTDSSSLVGFYGKLAGRKARSFSIGFQEARYNELHYAHIAARHFGTEQVDYITQPRDVMEVLEHLAEIYDEPFGNSSVVPAYCCARLAREHGVEVLLGGDGGDEIFGGNERYVTNLVFARYGRLPQALRKKLLEPTLARLPDKWMFHRAKRYVRRANIPNPDRFFSYNLLYAEDLSRIFRPEFLEAVDTDSFLHLAREHYDRAAPADETDRLLYLDMKFTITDNDIPKVTRMVEAAGLQVRYPFLDRDLVDFTTTIPPELKVKPGQNRYLFKKAMAGFLPREIIQKKKHGFGLPLGPWFAENQALRSLLEDTLLSSDTRLTQWVRRPFLENLFRELHQGDSRDYAAGNLWVFLVLELWLRAR